MNNEYKVYMHTFPNKKKYIGITRQDVSKRWGKGKHYKDQLVWKAINKYGWDNIKHQIIIDNVSKDVACKVEQELIRKYKTNIQEYGYNLSIGGEVGRKTNYMAEDCVQFIHKNTQYEENRKILEWWKFICEDKKESQVFNNAFKYVTTIVKSKREKHERIEDHIAIGAINVYLEAWINNWTPKSAMYNSLYYIENYSKIIMSYISGNYIEWKLKEPIITSQLTIDDYIE